MKKIAIFFIILLSCNGMLFADVIHLKGGAKVEGIIVQENETKVIIAVKVGEITYRKERIESISRASKEENARLKEKWSPFKKEESSLETKQKEEESEQLPEVPEIKEASSEVTQSPKLIYTVAFHDESTKRDYGYAVRLPPSYNDNDKFPVIFVFGENAKGEEAAARFSYAADKLGWIIIGPFDCLKGKWRQATEAQEAMLKDIVKRLGVDEKKFYAAGFGEGSRMAFHFAYKHPERFRGVIACSGGLPFGDENIAKNAVVYLCLGNTDANHREVRDVYRRLGEAGVSVYLNKFDGGRQWPPAEVINEALDWTAEKAK